MGSGQWVGAEGRASGRLSGCLRAGFGGAAIVSDPGTNRRQRSPVDNDASEMMTHMVKVLLT
jgi:hypothetical protein